jgi:hypothetical protein
VKTDNTPVHLQLKRLRDRYAMPRQDVPDEYLNRDYSEANLQKTFVKARMDTGLSFDDAWAAWKDFEARIHFIASEPFLLLYDRCGNTHLSLTNEQRVAMRRAARKHIGPYIRADDVKALAIAASWLGLKEPQRTPELAEELVLAINELAQEIDNPDTPHPNVDALVTRLRLLCPETAVERAASLVPKWLATSFLVYVQEHDLGGIAFEGQTRMFALALEDFLKGVKGTENSEMKTVKGFLAFLDARCDLDENTVGPSQ